jgi:hypothetical protein
MSRLPPPQHDPCVWPQVDEFIAPIVVQLNDLTAACRLIVAADDEKNLLGIVTAITEIRKVLRAGVPSVDRNDIPTAPTDREVCCGEYGNCLTRCVERRDGER